MQVVKDATGEPVPATVAERFAQAQMQQPRHILATKWQTVPGEEGAKEENKRLRLQGITQSYNPFDGVAYKEFSDVKNALDGSKTVNAAGEEQWTY